MNRAINRHRWNYNDLRNLLADPDTPQARVMQEMRARLSVRKEQPAFHPNATQFTLHSGDDRILALWRQSLDRRQSVFALHNVSDQVVQIPAERLNLIADEDWRDLFSDDRIGDGDIEMAPYQCRWISNIGH